MVRLRQLLGRFSRVNRLMAALAAFQLAYLAYEPLSYRRWARRYWSAVANAVPGYPASLIRGSLTAGPGPDLAVIDPSNADGNGPLGGPLQSPWDYDDQLYTKAYFAEPPRELSLEWISLRERQFYRGRFALPAARIDSLFAQVQAHPAGFGSFQTLAPNELYPYEKYLDQPVPGLTFVVRLEAGGYAGVWLAGPDPAHTIRLGRYRATAYTPDWPRAVPFANDPTPGRYLDRLLSRVDSAEQADPTRYPALP